jgi:hypothetical protein
MMEPRLSRKPRWCWVHKRYERHPCFPFTELGPGPIEVPQEEDLFERMEKRFRTMTADSHWQQAQARPAPVIYRPKSKGVEI